MINPNHSSSPRSWPSRILFDQMEPVYLLKVRHQLLLYPLPDSRHYLYSGKILQQHRIHPPHSSPHRCQDGQLVSGDSDRMQLVFFPEKCNTQAFADHWRSRLFLFDRLFLIPAFRFRLREVSHRQAHIVPEQPWRLPRYRFAPERILHP